MKKQCLNPYLPLYEHIPDGEPHVFQNRLYIFGSHDKENGNEFCEEDYVTWSCPVDDLSDWRYDGVIFRKSDDPYNTEGLPLYAPDVCQGVDGRYYLFYCVKFMDSINVAVCDKPDGHYTFLGRISYKDGRTLTENQPYDPSVIVVDGRVYLYYGFAPSTVNIPRYKDQDLKGCSVVELETDMLTVKDGPTIVLPSSKYADGTSFEVNPYFEAPSIRYIDGLYYLIYSSTHTHALCYATSKYPTKGFEYRGVIISNGDIGYNGRKEEDKLMSIGNNHGGLVEVNGQWYMFYHRHTFTNMYNRQGCAEKVEIQKDGFIPQVTITTSGMNPTPLSGKENYPAVYCCNLSNGHMGVLNSIGRPREDSEVDFPYLTSVNMDRYITNITDGTLVGYKYISLKDTTTIGVEYRGSGEGELKIYTSVNLEEDSYRGTISITPKSTWTTHETKIHFQQEDQECYLVYHGTSSIDLMELKLS